MRSAFMSDVFHALAAGEPLTVPVAPAATMWLMSRPRLIDNFVTALALDPAGLPGSRALTLPAMRVRMDALVAEVAAQAKVDPTLVRFAPDAAIAAAFGTQPPLSTPLATRLGMIGDGDLPGLVNTVLSDLTMGSIE